jgi:hypothetical protein
MIGYAGAGILPGVRASPGAATMEPPIEFEKVSFDEAKQALETKLREDKAKGWHGERAPQPAEPLFESTARRMETLPRTLRPVELAKTYPRIANRIADLWKRPSRCDAYFQTLMLDSRGRRQGFPPAVAMEISTLVAHYAKVYPYRHSIWDDVLKK